MARRPTASARKKAPRQEAPQSLEQATAKAARYIELLDQIDQERLNAQVAIDAITATRDGNCAPLEEEAKAIFRQLRPWWAANRDELTGGKRKSLEIAGAVIGERTTTPSLALPKTINLGRLVEFLVSKGLLALVRTKQSADKPACIRALRALERPEPGVGASDGHVMEYRLQRSLGEQLLEFGATVTQRDEFFIDRAGAPTHAPEFVETDDQGDLS